MPTTDGVNRRADLIGLGQQSRCERHIMLQMPYKTAQTGVEACGADRVMAAVETIRRCINVGRSRYEPQLCGKYGVAISRLQRINLCVIYISARG